MENRTRRMSCRVLMSDIKPRKLFPRQENGQDSKKLPLESQPNSAPAGNQVVEPMLKKLFPRQENGQDSKKLPLESQPNSAPAGNQVAEPMLKNVSDITLHKPPIQNAGVYQTSVPQQHLSRPPLQPSVFTMSLPGNLTYPYSAPVQQQQQLQPPMPSYEFLLSYYTRHVASCNFQHFAKGECCSKCCTETHTERDFHKSYTRARYQLLASIKTHIFYLGLDDPKKSEEDIWRAKEKAIALIMNKMRMEATYENWQLVKSKLSQILSSQKQQQKLKDEASLRNMTYTEYRKFLKNGAAAESQKENQPDNTV